MGEFLRYGWTLVIFFSWTLMAESQPQADKATPDIIHSGRYSQLENAPTLEQRDPLKVIIKLQLPNQITSIGDALDYLLLRSGYQLSDPTQWSQEIKQLLQLPLPMVHRRIGPIRLEQALAFLVGPAFVLQRDPVKRELSFQPVLEPKAL